MRNKKSKKALPFDIPFGFISGCYIELFGNKEAVLTGDCEIIELNDSVLKIRCGEHRISFVGEKLEVISYFSDGIRIGGVITSANFE
ncbi:MAG: YabP/YqfC family sporulation protein [Oscillospiraceae bacterium]|nr:YabP/YqfC family sporulation protein [Oscillospiraceae bacterium]